MPFKSKKQERYFQAVAHGMKPKKGGLTQAAAAKFVSHSKRYAGGGRITGSGLESLTGRAPRTPGSRTGSTLGRTGGLGAIGAGTYAGKGLSAKPTRPGAALSGKTPGTVAGTPSNRRPRPGRGVNPALALAGTTYYQARDRLDQLRPTKKRTP